MPLCVRHDREQDGHAVSGWLTSDELPVLATDRKSADRAFTQIVVNRQTAVGRKDIQCFPVVQDISNGLARG